MASKKSTAGKVRRRYTPDFKSEAVKLVSEQGLTRAQASRDLGVAESVLGRWVTAADATSRPGALSDAERIHAHSQRSQTPNATSPREARSARAADVQSVYPTKWSVKSGRGRAMVGRVGIGRRPMPEVVTRPYSQTKQSRPCSVATSFGAIDHADSHHSPRRWLSARRMQSHAQ